MYKERLCWNCQFMMTESYSELCLMITVLCQTLSSCLSLDVIVLCLEDPGFEHRHGKVMFLSYKPSRLAMEPTQPSVQWIQGYFSGVGVNQSWRGVHRSPPSSADVVGSRQGRGKLQLFTFIVYCLRHPVFRKLTLFPSSGTSVAISVLFWVHWIEIMSVRDCLCHGMRTCGDIQTKLQVGQIGGRVVKNTTRILYRRCIF